MTSSPSDAGAPLAGRRAVVMGAGSPACRAIALALAQGGADIAVTTATGAAEEAFELRSTARAIEQAGRRALVESVDLANGANVQVATRQLARQLGGVDLLFIRSEAPQERPSERLGDADWTRLINANLGAVFFACRGAAREMLSAQPDEGGVRGRIAVLLPAPADEGQGAVYVAARVAVQALVRGLAAEWLERGVLVNAIGLPAADTDEGNAAVAALALRLASADRGVSGELLIARPS